MGVSSIHGIQFFKRLVLFFMPVKHYPNVKYTRRVKTWWMHLFTLCQALGLIILLLVKSIPAIALAFPFVVVSMIGFRWSLKFIFTEKELEYLDGPNAGKRQLGADSKDQTTKATQTRKIEEWQWRICGE